MIDVVIVSNAKTEALYLLTEQAIRTSGANCIVVEQQPVEYDCLTVHYDFPFNYNKCLNLGYQHTANNVAFCNNDLLFHEGWQGIERHFDQYGSLSPLNPGWGFHTEFKAGVYEGYRTGRELCGWCLIVSRDTMEKTGGFDESVSFWGSDDVWGFQLQALGIKHALVADYKVHHLVSRTLMGCDRQMIADLTHGQAPLINEARQRWHLKT